MKRLLMPALVLLMLSSLSGCFILLNANTTDIEYIARLSGGPTAGMDITINDDNGDVRTFSNVTASEWSTAFTVAGKYIAFIEAEGFGDLQNLYGDYVQVEIRVDGRTKKVVTSFNTPWTATASMSVD